MHPLGLVIALAVVAGACGGDDKAHVSARVQAALPTQQLELTNDLCPEESAAMNLPADEVRRARARGRRQFVALEEAYRSDPETLVRTTYASSDEGDGEEDLTVRELARTHLLGATEEGITNEACFHTAARRLRALLDE